MDPYSTSDLNPLPAQPDEIKLVTGYVAGTKSLLRRLPQVESWCREVALLFASGISIESICERVEKPKSMVESWMSTTHFDVLFRSFASEIKKDSAANLLKGANVDNVRFLIMVRDNPSINTNTRLMAVGMMMKYANENKLLAGLINKPDESVAALADKHGSVGAGVDAELRRYFVNNPGLARSLTQPCVPETSQRDHSVLPNSSLSDYRVS